MPAGHGLSANEPARTPRFSLQRRHGHAALGKKSGLLATVAGPPYRFGDNVVKLLRLPRDIRAARRPGRGDGGVRREKDSWGADGWRCGSVLVRARSSGARRIGDALTMIPPVTGNGMSMAFESAAMAIAPLTAYSRGQIRWLQAQQALAHACDTCFGRRLAWARFLQWLMFANAMRHPLSALAMRSDRFWSVMFTRTR